MQACTVSRTARPGIAVKLLTQPAWRLCFMLPLVYFGAFLSGLRPARWFGTRLLPLAAAGFFVWFVMSIPWWGPRWALAVCLYGLLTANIFYVARTRDYA